MSSRKSTDRFSLGTSRFLLPTFRRPGYQEIMHNSVESEAADKVLFKWTQEEGQYYRLINTALLNDDFETLKENVQFINNLRRVIRNDHMNRAMNVYRGLSISSEDVKKEYKTGLQFLWPTFTSTSKDKEIAQRFGNYLFEIDVSIEELCYRADISQHSAYPYENEVLFYPYSGFMVTDVIPDAKVIRLKSVDTIKIEKNADKSIPELVKILDTSRNLYVYLKKNSPNTYSAQANEPDKMFLILDNKDGYWDSPYRYHHRNGYFVDKGEGIWEEYQQEKLFASFDQVC